MAVARESGEKNIGMREQNLLSLSYGKIIRKDIDSNEGLLPASFETYQIVRPGMTVLRFTDLQNDRRSLRSGLVQEQGIITSAYVAVEPFAAESRFFAYLMRAYDTNKVFYGMGGGVRQGLNFDSIRRLPVPDIHVDEQYAIADYLDQETAQIDALVVKQEEFIGLLHARRTAIVDAVVTRGLRQDVPLKPSGTAWLGDIPADWTIRPLWSMFRRLKCVGYPEEQMLSVFREFGVIAKDSRDNNNQTAENRNIYQLVHPGWLVTNRMKAWQGSVGVSELRGIVSGHYLCFEPRHNDDSRYLNWLFRCPRYTTGYASISRGVRIGQAEIDNDDYRVLPVVAPPMAEQIEIAAYLDDKTSKIDTLIAKANEHIALAKERRSALITAAVTGQLDVRTARRGA